MLMESPEAHTAPQRAERRENGVCAVVVTHHPDLSVLEQVLAALVDEVSSVVLVDNGSNADALSWLSDHAGKANRHFLPLGENLGLGVAHNRGIAWARQEGHRYALLLDQDSVPSPGMVARLASASQHLRAQHRRVAAVGPRYVDPVSGRASFFVRFGWLSLDRVWCEENAREQVIETDFLISSGLLVSIDAIDEIGGMDETLFIDHVDTEWFLRARALGFRAFGVCDAVMTHQLGNDTLSVWVGRWRSVPVHSPLRHYYAVRNSFLLYQRRYAPAVWIWNDVGRLLQMFCFYSLFTPPRLQHVRMMLKGAWHGIRGRAGRYRGAS